MSTRRALSIAAITFGLAACGHPASRAECEEIVRHTAELELRGQNVTDPHEIEKRMEEPGSLSNMRDLTDKCVGTRVTNSAMECVRKAATSKALEGCFQ